MHIDIVSFLEPLKTVKDIFQDYLWLTTVQGVNYLLFKHQTWWAIVFTIIIFDTKMVLNKKVSLASFFDMEKRNTERITKLATKDCQIQHQEISFFSENRFGKLFWSLVIASMIILGIYWSLVVWFNWQNQPVITTISTTALDISQIQFPAITFCALGKNKFNLWSGFLDQIFRSNLTNIDISPFDASKLKVRWQQNVSSFSVLFSFEESDSLNFGCIQIDNHDRGRKVQW